MQRRFSELSDVDGYLCNSIFFDIPSNGLHPLQCSRNSHFIPCSIQHFFSICIYLHSARFTNIKGNAVRTLHRFCVKINIICNEKFTRSNDSSTCLRRKYSRTIIRFPLCFIYFIEKPFVFSCTDNGKITSFFVGLSFFIEINRDV